MLAKGKNVKILDDKAYESLPLAPLAVETGADIVLAYLAQHTEGWIYGSLWTAKTKTFRG